MITFAQGFTLLVHRKIDFADYTVCTKYFTKVAFVDVLSKSFYYDLQHVSTAIIEQDGWATFELRGTGLVLRV